MQNNGKRLEDATTVRHKWWWSSMFVKHHPGIVPAVTDHLQTLGRCESSTGSALRPLALTCDQTASSVGFSVALGHHAARCAIVALRVTTRSHSVFPGKRGYVTSLLQQSLTSGEASEWSGVFFGSIPHHTTQG